MSLTEEGEENWEKIVDVILQHCRLLKEAADKNPAELARDWEETIALSKIFFETGSPSGVYDTAPGLTQSIARYGTEECLSAGRMLNESADTFPLEMLRDFASRLTPENMVIERCSQTAWAQIEKKADVKRMKEQWYGLDFIVSKIDPTVVKKWRGDPAPLVDAPSLALPRPNRFIPRTLDLCDDLPDEAKLGPRIEKPIDPPNLLVDNRTTGRLWHRLDDRYALPKANLTVLVRNAAVGHVKNGDGVWEKDTSASVHASILSSMYYDAMAVDTYDADLAGLFWSLSCGQLGIKVSCSGFSDRMPDLALTIVKNFYSSSEFLQPHYLASAKDRMLRNLRTYFESRRADSHAVYYRDFLMASESLGIDASIEETERVTMESIKAYHRVLLDNNETLAECFYTGNVSEATAKQFFQDSSAEITSSRSSESSCGSMWIPAAIERRILPGTEFDLHFSSKNPQEENGATMVTYQSSIPGFRGDELSSQESLESTAAIRVISTIIREPLFDELRTKQTLGYIVSSYYDLGFSSPPPGLPHYSVPVDFLVISVLSKKLPPTEVASRIGDFLVTFREQLEAMPQSEIDQYTTALSTKLLKPFQKLSSEAGNQFGKIERYAPEVGSSELPWNSVESLAGAIRQVKRQDLVSHWDRLTHPSSRARVVSHVYGTTHPLDPKRIASSSSNATVVVNSLKDIQALRDRLPIYDNSKSKPNARTRLRRLMRNRNTWAVGAIVGAGVVGWSIYTRSKKSR